MNDSLLQNCPNCYHSDELLNNDNRGSGVCNMCCGMGYVGKIKQDILIELPKDYSLIEPCQKCSQDGISQGTGRCQTCKGSGIVENEHMRTNIEQDIDLLSKINGKQNVHLGTSWMQKLIIFSIVVLIMCVLLFFYIKNNRSLSDAPNAIQTREQYIVNSAYPYPIKIAPRDTLLDSIVMIGDEMIKVNFGDGGFQSLAVLSKNTRDSIFCLLYILKVKNGDTLVTTTYKQSTYPIIEARTDWVGFRSIDGAPTVFIFNRLQP